MFPSDTDSLFSFFENTHNYRLPPLAYLSWCARESLSDRSTDESPALTELLDRFIFAWSISARTPRIWVITPLLLFTISRQYHPKNGAKFGFEPKLLFSMAIEPPIHQNYPKKNELEVWFLSVSVVQLEKNN